MTRGEVFKLPQLENRRGHEQQGDRYAVVVQADELLGLSTVLVAPTSTRAMPTSFRPEIKITAGRRKTTATRVLVEQTSVIDPSRLGRSAGRLDAFEQRAVDDALQLMLGL